MFTVRRPRLKFLAPLQSTKFLLSPKNKIKNKKKGRHYIFGFSYRLLAPPGAFWRPLNFLAPPGAFCTPKYFFPHHRTLIWPTYGTFLQPNNFNSKFWPPPFSWCPPATPGQPGLRYATDVWYISQGPQTWTPHAHGFCFTLNNM